MKPRTLEDIALQGPFAELPFKPGLFRVVLLCPLTHEPADPYNMVSSSIVQTWYKPPPMDNFDHYTMGEGFRR